MEPLIRDWFQSKFKDLTEPQAYAVPLIHERKSVLVSSPTGSGKTLTAFLSIINELYAKQLRGELEDRIYCLYVSPLKALANDINRNLEEPLQELTALAEEEGKFLAGFSNGKVRDMHIVEVDTRKSLDLAVLCPVRDITAVPMEVANARMYDLLSDLIDEHRTTLIFTNTRSGTEHVSFRLKERGVEDLEAHHGSLSKVTRLDVEQKLKEGKLKAAVSSTSLELGIDIGYIDLVVQIGSPKSVAKGLQRIGRAGHAYGETATGRMIAFEPWDLMECATLAKAAYDARIDRVEIPQNPLDVLAQAMVAMSLEKRWDIDEAFELARRSYPFHDLPKKDFLAVLDYLSSRNPDIKV